LDQLIKAKLNMMDGKEATETLTSLIDHAEAIARPRRWWSYKSDTALRLQRKLDEIKSRRDSHIATTDDVAKNFHAQLSTMLHRDTLRVTRESLEEIQIKLQEAKKNLEKDDKCLFLNGVLLQLATDLTCQAMLKRTKMFREVEMIHKLLDPIKMYLSNNINSCFCWNRENARQKLSAVKKIESELLRKIKESKAEPLDQLKKMEEGPRDSMYLALESLKINKVMTTARFWGRPKSLDLVDNAIQRYTAMKKMK